ncbi:MAG: NAD(P)/FAD-dependent oxidoreductase [Candidatus Micrarchaeota archaeon]|nr:NAD(P)/FAD-dependent oxidoreductase [Candidatus Micrarchaeota archaeon]
MSEVIYQQDKVEEVAIIGGGPAGLSAAYYCAKAGLRTIILEEHKEVGKPIHCGEGLSLYAIKRMELKDIPADALGLKVKGIRVVFPSGDNIVYREEGYDLNKELFEKYLLERAEAQGAKIYTESRVLNLSRKNGIWSIQSTRLGLKSKAVIDATGYQSFTNKTLKINTKEIELIAGAQYLLDNVTTDGFIEFYLDPKLAPGGYLWIMPKDNNRANVGLISTATSQIQQSLKLFLQKKGLEKNKIIRPFGGMIPCSGPLEKTYADGLLLVGDAAGFTSPMFEGGTQLALKSGQIAAQTLIDCYKEGVEKNLLDPYEEQYLKIYQERWEKEFPPYQKILKGKKHFYSYSEEELNLIAKILPNDLTNLTLASKIQILFRLFTKAPKLIGKNFFSAMNTFSYSTGQNYGW